MVQLKYPLTTREISTFVFEDLCREHCYFADDVNEDFNRAVRPETFDELNRVVMISTPPPAAGPKSEEEQERLAKMRKEQGRRLQEQAAKKRAEKVRNVIVLSLCLPFLSSWILSKRSWTLSWPLPIWPGPRERN